MFTYNNTLYASLYSFVTTTAVSIDVERKMLQ